MNAPAKGKKSREEYSVGERMYSELTGDRIGPPPKSFTGRKKEIWNMYREQAPWLCVADTHAFAVFCTLATKLETDWYALQATEKTLVYDLMSTLGFHPLARAHLATKKKNVAMAGQIKKGLHSAKEPAAPTKENRGKANGHTQKDVESYFN